MGGHGAEPGRAGRELFTGDTVDVARRLLGCELVHEERGAVTAGRIVEVEAYLAEGDDASHSRCGRTARNASMFLAAGHAYVYVIYGMHLCFNVVTGEEGAGEAVLVRALEPTRGRARMRERRGGRAEREWCAGPGRLAQALAIEREHDGVDLVSGPLRIVPLGDAEHEIVCGKRIGIRRDAELPLRFGLRDCPWLSRPFRP